MLGFGKKLPGCDIQGDDEKDVYDDFADDEDEVEDEKQRSEHELIGSQSKGEVPSFIDDDMLTSLLYVPGL